MTDDQAAIAALQAVLAETRLRLRDLERQIATISAAYLSMHRRLQLQEAGTALYEIANEEHRGRSH